MKQLIRKILKEETEPETELTDLENKGIDFVVKILKKNYPFKVLVDPSHAMGDSKYVHDASMAALAAGADGLLIEVHPDPKSALSDPEQALDLTLLRNLVNKLEKACPVFNKNLRV